LSIIDRVRFCVAKVTNFWEDLLKGAKSGVKGLKSMVKRWEEARMADIIVDAEYCANMNPVGGDISFSS
jgi:hypothetical protein